MRTIVNIALNNLSILETFRSNEDEGSNFCEWEIVWDGPASKKGLFFPTLVCLIPCQSWLGGGDDCLLLSWRGETGCGGTDTDIPSLRTTLKAGSFLKWGCQNQARNNKSSLPSGLISLLDRTVTRVPHQSQSKLVLLSLKTGNIFIEWREEHH